MKGYFIYEVNILKKGKQSAPQSYVVIFCPDTTIDRQRLKHEIKEFFQTHIIPDDIVIIGGSYLQDEIKKVFIDETAETFSDVNNIYKPHFENSINVLIFGENGQLSVIKNRIERPLDFYKKLIAEGLRWIFEKRGGLIESNEAHHFVFPSGKHSSKFLRTGNILLYSPEIYFIASSLLEKYDPINHNFILCDTSSINSIAFALTELKKRYNSNYPLPPINSFKSYSIFEEEELTFGGKSLFLVSASTSGGIIERLRKKMDAIKKENIALIYFLGDEKNAEQYANNIVCNLSKSASDAGYGIDSFETYKAQDCVHCDDDSSPIMVVGDTFLREKPKVKRVLLKKEHAPECLSNFVKQFMSNKKVYKNIIKCNYKENNSPEEQYDIYFDMNEVLRSILDKPEKNEYLGFKKRLNKQLSIHTPTNTKYIIALHDEGSETLAKLILKEFEKTHNYPPKIILQNDIFSELNKNDSGVAIIACSSMVNGGNLLYLSRALRAFDGLSIIYFIGLIRTINHQYSQFIERNLSNGSVLGNKNNPFVSIECMYLQDDYRNTTWLQEKDVLEKLELFLEDKEIYKDASVFFQKRYSHIISVDKNNKGLSNELFYPDIINGNKELDLNKNFAFLDFNKYHGNVSQADVYFIMSVILNDLRHKRIKEDTLRQSEYERNVIDPSNFLRFNDGIIQSAILRAAQPQEMQYELDDTCSSQMRDIMLDMINYSNRPVSEALMEFVYALSTKKMRLKESDRESVFKKLKTLNNSYIDALCDFYIDQKSKKLSQKTNS